MVSVGKGDMSTAIREGFISMDLEMMESMFACMSGVFACMSSVFACISTVFACMNSVFACFSPLFTLFVFVLVNAIHINTGFSFVWSKGSE